MEIYNFKVKKRDGSNESLKEFKGKVISRFAPTVEPKDIEKHILELL